MNGSVNGGAHLCIAVLLGALALTGSAALARLAAGSAQAGETTLSAKDLYNGFEARKVALDKDGGKLLLDERVLKFGKEKEGRVITDPIDLGPAEGIVGLGGAVQSVDLEVQAEVPAGASVEVETRSSANGLEAAGWSDWKKLPGLKGTVDKPAGRWLQVKVTLKGTAADKLPALTALVLKPAVAAAPAWAGKLEVAESKIQKLVRSTIDFQYERPDQEKLAKFRKDNNLDEVVAGKLDEQLRNKKLTDIDDSMKGGEDFVKLVRLMDWVGHCRNDRTIHKESEGGFYQWNIEKVFELKEVEEGGKKVKQPTIYGHCMSFSEVLVTAATAMGYVGSHHLCMVGFREASHEITDIWVPSLGKWVYFDPSLSNYYFDKETKVPMNLIEMHKLVADKFVPEGKDMHWWIVRGSEETRARVKEVGGTKHIGCRLGRWKYGDPMPENYEWGWAHGYLAAGFVQMTPRNDFHSHPDKTPKSFGNGPGYGGFPFWVDDKTPPERGVNNWYTRLRDFYWTLDQAGLKLVKAGEGTLSVELGQTMPFFKKYVVKVDGAEVKDEVKSPFTWTLKAGENKLEVAPVDEFGKVGLSSTVTVKYTK
jgi:hypothetical protein